MIETIKIKNLVKKEIIELNMSEANYLIYEGSVDWGSVEVSHNTFQFPQQIGEYVTNTVLGTRDISIYGWIIGNTIKEIENKKAKLSTMINPLQELEIIVDNYSINGKPSSNVTYGKTYQENNDVMCKFLIEVFCPQPLFILTNSISIDVADIKPFFGFPLIFKQNGIIMALRKKSLFTDISNSGAVSVGMKIVMKASGTVNNPEIVNVNTHELIKINKTLVAGEIIEIDTNLGNRSVIGKLNNQELNYFGYFDFDNTWLQLENGISTFTYRTYDSNNELDETYKKLTVNISYKLALYNLNGE